MAIARPKERIKGPVDHLGELLIAMRNDLKGATGGGKSHSTKKPMEGVLGNEWHTFIQEGLPGHKVEGI